ncbi:MAG: hypothetical protein D9N11_02870 [Ketobacter sp.]|nr:MAG: hypothetical protein D9N11_02870 [Ketobacter sp.]
MLAELLAFGRKQAMHVLVFQVVGDTQLLQNMVIAQRQLGLGWFCSFPGAAQVNNQRFQHPRSRRLLTFHIT